MRAALERLSFAAVLIMGTAVGVAAAPTDEEVQRLIIQESIASYPGNCPCPYNRAANGSMRGKRSAWSKPGGYDPICYPEEVTADMIEDWRRKHGE